MSNAFIRRPVGMDYVKYTFEIKARIKGINSQKYFAVYSIKSTSMCGAHFNIDEEYYVFSNLSESFYKTNSCYGNIRKVKNNKVYSKIINKYKKQEKKLKTVDKKA